MYRIYTISDCQSCDRIIDYVKSKGIDCKIVNCEREKPNLAIFIFPALFYNDSLLAYGDDIITYFNNRQQANG